MVIPFKVNLVLSRQARGQWLMPINLSTWGAEIGRISGWFKASLGKILRNPSQWEKAWHGDEHLLYQPWWKVKK
jgi:hypothetical protein